MKKVVCGLALLVLSLVFIACDRDENDLERSENLQADVQQRAYDAEPPYEVSEFSIREDINWYLQETEGRSVWYVYALDYLGEPVFYVVSDMRATNICVNITAPEIVVGRNSRAVITAPSLNGVYRKAGACSTFFLRDTTTDSYIEVSGSAFTLISSKQPLAIYRDVELLTSQ